MSTTWIEREFERLFRLVSAQEQLRNRGLAKQTQKIKKKLIEFRSALEKLTCQEDILKGASSGCR